MNQASDADPHLDEAQELTGELTGRRLVVATAPTTSETSTP
ncbi:hypothetical protein [Nocardioides panacihumi]